jgi:hypothetical protein
MNKYKYHVSVNKITKIRDKHKTYVTPYSPNSSQEQTVVKNLKKMPSDLNIKSCAFSILCGIFV